MRFEIWQFSPLLVCVFNEVSHAEADGGAILDSAGSAAQSLVCKFTAQQEWTALAL